MRASREPSPMPAPLSIVVITGLSGAGKSYAIKCFEDMGFFCVDNLPTTLIPTFADLIARSGQTLRRVALGVDVREGEYLSHLLDAIREITDRIVDTSALTVHRLKELLIEHYVTPRARPGLTTSLVSFGFKHGVPFDADLVFDVRFLPNPHFVPGLR